jgi:hypothetical protein
MGTTLHAVVQIFYPSTGEHTRDYWESVCEWELNKNYELMMYLQQDGQRRSQERWPDDLGDFDKSRYEYRGDSPGDRFWSTREQLDNAFDELNMKIEQGESFSGSDDEEALGYWVVDRLGAMLAAIDVLVDTFEHKVRILFYKM